MVLGVLVTISLSQSLQRPWPAGMEVPLAVPLAVGTTKTSSAFSTGYTPFEMELDCTFDPATNGCWARARLDFNTVVNGEYPYRGRQPYVRKPAPIVAVEGQLSGFELSLDGASSTMPLAEIEVETQTITLGASIVEWIVRVNWRDAPYTMIDNFHVRVGGELVWTTGVNSTVTTKTFSCSDLTSSCSSTQVFSTKWAFAGAALGNVRLSTSRGGQWVDSLGSQLSVVVGGAGQNLVQMDVGCSIGGSPTVECSHRVVVVSARGTEAEPFVSAPFAHADPLGQPYLSGQSQSALTLSAHREMGCGLRTFEVSSSPAGRVGAVRVGAMPTDCGFNGIGRGGQASTWSYGGLMRHHFLVNAGSGLPAQPYASEFTLDGAKLVWP